MRFLLQFVGIKLKYALGVGSFKRFEDAEWG